MRIDNAGEVMIGSTSSDGIYKLKVIGATCLGGAVTGPTSITTTGAVTSATLTTTGNIVCGGTLTGATAITTSGDMTCYQVKSTVTKQFDVVLPQKKVID